MKKIEKRICALRDQVNRYLEKEDISDISYHQHVLLFEKLKKLEKKYPEYICRNSPTQRLGIDSENQFLKTKYKFPFLTYKSGSLQNIYGLLFNSKGIIAEKGISGLRVCLNYNEGQLNEIVMNGVASVGTDISQNARTIENIPYFIDRKGELIVQGIIYLPLSEFKKRKKSERKFKNPDHAVKCIMKLKTSRSVADYDLRFCARSLISKAYSEQSYLEMNSDLEKLGFETEEYTICKTRKDINNVLDRSNTGDIPYDGFIFKKNRCISFDERKNLKRFERDSFIYYKPKLIKARIIGVDWKKQKTGILIPIIVFEKAINFKGTKIFKLQLKNAEEFESLSLYYNDFVEIDISTSTPKLARIIESLRVENPIPIKQPLKCSICNSSFVRSGKHLYGCDLSSCNHYRQKLENDVSFKLKHKTDVSLSGDWKFIHLKIVAEFFGALAFKNEDDSSSAFVLFDTTDQLAKISYTLNAEKMPVKVYSNMEKYSEESQNKILPLWDSERFYMFDMAYYDTNFSEIKNIMGCAFSEMKNYFDDTVSIPVLKEVKHSTISLFFFFLGIEKKEPLRIICYRHFNFPIWQDITTELKQQKRHSGLLSRFKKIFQ